MPDIGNAYVNIVPKAPGIESKIDSLLGGASESAGASSGESIGKGLMGSLGKVVTVAAVGKVLKDAFSAGGNLEQSFGGLDTIYGEASEQAKAFAEQAASAGISANTYAEQAVSFGAALKNAYGGDTQKAMEAANLAIMDMADNSAKMGTDITSVQNAYAGFAKQNYTMLDNLKLGYGGTKSEMERLLADAQKLTGIEYNIDNLGDVYSAIHAIQGELGLTGVAAAEAETTLTGSFGALKASWENLLAAMTTGRGLDTAVQNLGKSLGNVLNNVLRMAGNLASQLPSLISGLLTTILPTLTQVAQQIVTGLVSGIGANLPQMLQSGLDLIVTLALGIAQALPTLAQSAVELIPVIVTAIVGALPQIIESGIQVITALIQGIVDSWDKIIESIGQVIQVVVTAIVNNLPQIIESGIKLLLALLDGILKTIPKLLEFVPKLFSETVSAFRSIDWGSIGIELINGIINGLWSGASALWDTLANLASAAWSWARSAFQIGSPSKLFADGVGKWIPAGIAVGIDENMTPVNTAVSSMAMQMSGDFQRMTADGQPAYGQGAGIDYAKLAQAISSRPVVIQGDTNKIFRVVKDANETRTRATGYNILALQR